MFFSLLSKLAAIFLWLFNHLDEDAKRQVIEAIVNGFEELLRYFYRKYKQQDQE